MKKSISIYLAGTIKKGKDEEHELCWTDEHKTILKECCKAKELELVFLDPQDRSDDLSDQLSVFGRDMFQLFSSDLVLVDARGRRGLGVGAEMMFAKTQRIPLISWLPTDSYYQRKDIHFLGQKVQSWIHPFVYTLSDYLAPTLEHVASWIENELLGASCAIKGPETMQQAMSYYLETQLQFDHGMRELIFTNQKLTKKLELIQS